MQNKIFYIILRFMTIQLLSTIIIFFLTEFHIFTFKQVKIIVC